jgi:hypothetical protein
VSTPPSADEFYLAASESRAVFQGDVFVDVPITKAAAGNTVASEPHWSAKRLHAATVSYPCDIIVASDGVTLNKAQAVVPVYRAADYRITVPDDWEGAWSVCPLPDLVGDGAMWVADFRRITTIDRSYLRLEDRVRCLSEVGWAWFRRRLITALTRGTLPVEDLVEIGASTWAEAEFETRWVVAGRDPKDFQTWLDEVDLSIGVYPSRRAALADTTGRDAVEHALSSLLGP